MEHIVDWVKNYILVFFLMMILLSLTAKKEYKSYIRFFMEMVLVVTIVTPLLGLFGKSEDFMDKIEYDSFWQELNTLQADEKKMNYINEEYYVSYYEDMVAEDVAGLAEKEGYAAVRTKVDMDEQYEIRHIGLTVSKQGEGSPIIIGKIGGKEEDGEITKLKKKVADYYQIEESAVEISD